ncbi:MAG: hypothetical protein WCS42_11145 [Verrucomicrobiota bacterium]
MKRWACLTVFLYALALLVLTLPVMLFAFANWGQRDMNIGLREVCQTYANWAYWVWLAVLLAGQALLLLLPIRIAERRLPARRALKIPVIVTAFFLGNLLLAGLFSLLCAIFLDDGFNVFLFVDRIANRFRSEPVSGGTTCGSVISLLIIMIIFWIIWGIIFRRATRSDEPDVLLKRSTKWLLRGSILELLIAVPSHVLVRRRDDCCAPMGTFWGIATGISVMLLCFGPGVFFLFVERCRKLKPNRWPV